MNIEELKNIPLTSLLAQITGQEGVKRGGRMFFLSPLRAESNASFCVDEARNLWYDFGTGEGGDVVRFIMQYKGVDFNGACRFLREEYNGDIPVSPKKMETPLINDVAVKMYPSLVKMSDSGKVAEYFKNKGVAVPEGAVIFPYGKGGWYVGVPTPHIQKLAGIECRGVQYGSLEDSKAEGKKLRITIGKKIPWVSATVGGKLLLTESILDALAGKEIIGDISLCSLNGVANCQKYLPLVIKKYQPSEIIIALDNDEAGQNCRKVAERICDEAGAKHKTSQLYNGYKDLYDLYSKVYLKTRRNK